MREASNKPKAYGVYIRGDETYRLVMFAKGRDEVRLTVRKLPEFLGLQAQDIFVQRYYEFDGEYRGHPFLDWNDPYDRKAMVLQGWRCGDHDAEDCRNCSAKEFPLTNGSVYYCPDAI